MSYWNLKVTIFQIKLASNKQITKLAHSALMWHILVFAHSVQNRMFVDHAHSSQIMEWQNLGIAALKYATCDPNVSKNCWEIK